MNIIDWYINLDGQDYGALIDQQNYNNLEYG